MCRFWLAKADYSGGPTALTLFLNDQFGGFVETETRKTLIVSKRFHHLKDCVEISFLVTPATRDKLDEVRRLLGQKAKAVRQPFIDIECGGQVERIFAD